MTGVVTHGHLPYSFGSVYSQWLVVLSPQRMTALMGFDGCGYQLPPPSSFTWTLLYTFPVLFNSLMYFRTAPSSDITVSAVRFRPLLKS